MGKSKSFGKLERKRTLRKRTLGKKNRNRRTNKHYRNMKGG